MIIDIHTHIFPRKICEQREDFFHDEPDFKLLYDSPRARLVGADELIKAMDEDGIDRSVVFGFPWNRFDTVKLNNDYILEMIKTYPDRLTGFCCLDPAHPCALQEVSRCVQGGMKGIGELAFYRSGIDQKALDKLLPVMSLCSERNLPVLIHTNESIGHSYPGKAPVSLPEIYRLAQHFPDNHVILAHWGGGLFFYNLLKNEVKETLRNVYVDTAASPFLYDPQIYPVAVKIFGAEKILFGSDFPLLKPSRYLNEMKKAGLSADDMNLICCKNAEKLLPHVDSRTKDSLD